MLLVRRDDFRDVINYVDYFWSVNNFGKCSANRIIKIQKTQAKFVKLYLWSIVLSGLTYVVQPAFSDERDLPLFINICSVETSLACYLVSYAFQSGCIATLLCHVMMLDSLFLNLLLCGYCELEQIKYAFPEVKTKYNVNEQESEVLQQLIVVVKHHINVLE